MSAEATARVECGRQGCGEQRHALYSLAAVRPETLQYLQARLDDVRNLRLFPFSQERPDLVSSALASAGGALEALRDVGLISDDEFSEWS